MSTDLVHVGTDDEFAALAPADRAAWVTNALVESKQWLTVATKNTDPTPITNHRAWAATVVEMTRQKGLASEIQSDALEMFRLLERGTAVVVRNGQKAGEIRRPSREIGKSPDGHREQMSMPKPVEFFSGDQERSDSYAMADLATDEEFDQVLTEARAEGNLSRANVVRKIKDSQQSPVSRKDRADLIEDMATKGLTSTQMARRVGVTEESVRLIARDFGITIPADQVTRRTRRIDSTRVVRETVQTLEGLAIGLPLVDMGDLDPREVQHWTASLDQSIRALSRFNKALRKAVL